LSPVDREQHERALRMALWLALFHARQLGDDETGPTLTALLGAVKKKHGVPGPIV
jgi:hypothetical protein